MQKTPEGKFVSRYPVKFPLKTGISNYIYQHGIELVSANDPRQQKLFTPEIDNVSGAPAVKNMIISNDNFVELYNSNLSCNQLC